MRKSHADAAVSEFPTPRQMKEFWTQVASGRITRSTLQAFLRGETAEDYLTILDDAAKKTSEIVAEMRAHFRVWSCWSDEELDKQFPPPPKPTERKFKNTKEPDGETAGKSAWEVDRDDKRGITLRECLIMELNYWIIKRRHLNIRGEVLCNGSRSGDGNIPSVGWRSYGAGVLMIWNGYPYLCPCDGVRLAVS